MFTFLSKIVVFYLKIKLFSVNVINIYSPFILFIYFFYFVLFYYLFNYQVQRTKKTLLLINKLELKPTRTTTDAFKVF